MLKDGSEPLDPRLDRLYQEDARNANYPITAPLQARATPRNRTDIPKNTIWTITNGVLDQGRDGACVGFAFAHELIADPQVITSHQGSPVDARFAKETLYWEFQKIDEWPGGSYPGATPFYEGTSVLAGAKVMKSNGFYTSYYWGLSLRQTVLGVSHEGPCVAGLPMYEGMYKPNAQGFLVPTGRIMGGHAVLIFGIQMRYKHRGPIPVSRIWNYVDLDNSYFIIRNSWGPRWADKGNAKISLRHFDKLLKERGEAMFPHRAAA